MNGKNCNDNYKIDKLEKQMKSIFSQLSEIRKATVDNKEGRDVLERTMTIIESDIAALSSGVDYFFGGSTKTPAQHIADLNSERQGQFSQFDNQYCPGKPPDVYKDSVMIVNFNKSGKIVGDIKEIEVEDVLPGEVLP